MAHTPRAPRLTPIARSLRSARSMAGFTLMETLLGLGIASGVAIMALGFGAKVMDTAKLEQTRKLTSILSSQVQARFALFPNYSSLPGTPAAAWVTDLPMDGPNVEGPWGSLQLKAASVNATHDAWAMTFNNVPADMCIKLISTMSSSYYATGANGAMSAAAPNQAVSPGEAQALCNANLNAVNFVSPPSATSRGTPVAAAMSPPAPSSLPAWTGAVATSSGSMGDPVTGGPGPSPTPLPTMGPPVSTPAPTPIAAGCFSPDTLVMTSRGPVAIGDIKAGDMVASLWIQDLEIDDPKVLFAWSANELPDAFDYAEVLHVHSGAEPSFYRINGSLDATWEHPFMVQRDNVWRWTRARDLVPGDKLRSLDGVALVESVELIEEATPTNNLDVISPYDNFLVQMGGSWVLVHNLIAISDNKY